MGLGMATREPVGFGRGGGGRPPFSDMGHAMEIG